MKDSVNMQTADRMAHRAKAEHFLFAAAAESNTVGTYCRTVDQPEYGRQHADATTSYRSMHARNGLFAEVLQLALQPL